MGSTWLVNTWVDMGLPSDVMVRGIRALLDEEERDALEHLIAVERGEREIEEQTVQHSGGDEV